MTNESQTGKIGTLFAAAAFISVLTLGRAAHANEWLVVPATTEEEIERSESTAEELADQLEKQGMVLRSSVNAAKDFEKNASRPPSVPTEQEIEAWAGQSREALRALARKDYAGALALLEKAQAFSQRAVDELNRDPGRAERLLDTCLYTVRALLGSGQRAEARIRAEECARLSLHAKPNSLMHPPDVRAFYDAVWRDDADDIGSLVVKADRADCDVRVNGFPQGPTPRRIDGLLRGFYDLQVECDERRGRVHRIEVADETTEIFVDTRFDRSIRTERGLALSYAVWPDPAKRLSDATRIAEATRVGVLVLVLEQEDGSVELWATDTQGQPKGFARTAADPEGPSELALAAAAATVAAGECLDLSGERPLAVSCRTGLAERPAEPTEEAPRTKGPPRGQFIAGVTLASLGTASLLASYALTATADTSAADDMVAFPSNDNQARWLNLRSGMYYTGAVGAGLLVTAMPLALPYHRKPPWWAWLCGGAGVALAATSITLAVTAPSEPDASRVADPQGYVGRAKRTDPAFATGVTAAPLLTVPLLYLLRRDEKRTRASLTPQMSVSRAGGFFAIEGRY